MTTPRSRAPLALPKPARGVVRVGTRLVDGLEDLGRHLRFYLAALLWLPRAAARYWREVARLVADISFGSGALLVGGGTVAVIFALSFFSGSELGLQGFKGLQIIGLAPLSGVISAYANTREIAPLVAGVGLAAQVGCGFTAQLGAMRISEEIDALEVMAVPSLPYLVSTRILAAFTAVVPLYLVGLFASYVATEVEVVYLNHQSKGTYLYYFHRFLPTEELLLSLVKAVVFAVIVTLVHCFYGYHAAGGPEGVGRAAGRALRTSIVAIVIVDLVLTFVLYGANPSVRISG
ncbi:MAG TPA: ABC transporter permease [Mycobacteriales bacterium]|nr:ABC transporter permease [Mycobacteriales bacterium]